MKKLITTVLAVTIALSLGTPLFAADTKEQARAAAKAKLVDINTATEEQLKSGLNIGDENAKKIVAGRPYKSKGDLKTKNVVDNEVYEQIQKLIAALC